MRGFFSLFLISQMILPCVKAQDTLPGFSAYQKTNGKVLISWRNTYPAINQISIQKSKDSLRNFTTLITVPDPRIPENGFVDNKVTTGTKMYYRIFILFPNSKYTFTKSKRAILESAASSVSTINSPPKEHQKTVNNIQGSSPKKTSIIKEPGQRSGPIPGEEDKYLVLPKIDNARIFYPIENQNLKRPTINSPGKIKTPTIEVQKWLYVKKGDSVIMIVAGTQVVRFSDSILKKTRDTLLFLNADTLQIKPFVEVYKEPKEVYKVSSYVFVSKDGNVNIALPDYNKKKYFVAFYETDNTPVLEVKDIKDPMLIIDKTNFVHAGWFRFELFEDGKLKEKNKLQIPKD